MITKFNIFESEKTPDLRRFSTYVRCIKDYFYENKLFFSKGNVYKVDGLYGDAQGAVEKYGIQDYVPVELIEAIIISSNNEKFRFSNSLTSKLGRIVASFHGKYTTADDGNF